jgi:guanidinopropionase
MRDSQVMLRALSCLDLVGGDVCEVAPPLDPSGLTCIAAANMMFEILCLIATARSARR